jgi:hypothetical protein
MGALMARLWPCGIALVLCVTAPAKGQDSVDDDHSDAMGEAQARFRRGLELYGEDDFRAALVEFQRAYELAPSFRILYNIAQVQFQLQDYAGSLRSFERYLQEGADRIDAERRQDVERDLERLRTRVARIAISAEHDGVEVYVDDVWMGVTPLPPVLVSSGRRRVRARLEGHAPVTHVVDVAGAEQVTLRLQFDDTKSQAAAMEPEAPGIAHSEPMPVVPAPTLPLAPDGPEESSVPWVGWTITGLLAVGAATTGVLALRASSDLQDLRAKPNVGRDALDDASSDTKRWALATDVLGVGAVVAGGISLYLTLNRDAEPEGASGVQWNLGPGSLGVAGRF